MTTGCSDQGTSCHNPVPQIEKEAPERLSGPVTTPRTDVHYVVTENGVANLKGLSSTERAHALIGLADLPFKTN
jgi:itaconate CoA-transferase